MGISSLRSASITDKAIQSGSMNIIGPYNMSNDLIHTKFNISLIAKGQVVVTKHIDRKSRNGQRTHQAESKEVAKGFARVSQGEPGKGLKVDVFDKPPEENSDAKLQKTFYTAEPIGQISII